MTDIWDHDLPSERAAAINRDRMKTYGSPITVFDMVAPMWSALLGMTVTQEDVAAMMILFKTAREKCGNYDPNYLDNEDDVCGYSNVLHIIKQAKETERSGGSDSPTLPPVYDHAQAAAEMASDDLPPHTTGRGNREPQ